MTGGERGRLAGRVFPLVLIACGSKDQPPPPKPAPADAAPAPVAVAPDWAVCKTALEGLPKSPPLRRIQVVLDACRPCGDWKPLLDWSIARTEGGPTIDQLEAAFTRCNAFCMPDAKQKTMGAIESSRGTTTRGPFRQLGEVCKDAVSAVPDNRYASAPYFALDRIGRAAAEHADIAPLLDAALIPLPPVSISGFGYDLARSPVTAPDAGPIALTVTPTEIRIAELPHAKLGKTGVTVVAKGESYPGALVKTVKDFETALPTYGDPGAAIAILAPHGMVASRLLDTLQLTGDRPRAATGNWLSGDVRIAVAADKGPPGWTLTGSIPVALRIKPSADAVAIEIADDADAAIGTLKAKKADLLALAAKRKSADTTHDRSPMPGATQVSTMITEPTLTVTLGPKTTVEQLAKLLGAAVYFDVKSVALIAAKK